MYQQLLVLREGLYQTVDLSCASSSGAPVVASEAVPMTASQMAQSANDETKILKDENTKLKYRIGILLKTIDEIENKKWIDNDDDVLMFRWINLIRLSIILIVNYKMVN